MDMFKSGKNFLFILFISIVTLVILVVGAVVLRKDNSLTFSSDGYIIETTSKTSTKYYFSANTKYKENVDEMIMFNDVDDEKRIVDPASFVHYSNGDVMFLKKGALVNLKDINSPMVNYYNITNLSTINYDDGNYIVSSNDNKITIESFVGRISDNKYLVSGKNLRMKIPNEVQELSGEYFEILFVEDGIVKISSEKADYQVTAEGSYIYIGDEYVINLGDGKISYDGVAKMLLSQITINGDENIDLDVDEENKNSGGGGGGSGSGTGNGSGEGEGDGTGSGGGSGGVGDGVSVDESPRIELIDAVVTSTSIDLTLQLNNADKVSGNLLYYFTNLGSGKREGNSMYIDLVNGTFLVSQESLSPSTEYSFSIVEVGEGSEKYYFQKTFRTSDLGITLEKNYATDSSLGYSIKFDENTEVSQVRVSIYDDNGKNDNILNNQVIIAKDDIDNSFVFEGLKSNTTHSVSVDMVWIDNAAYSDVYSINRLDSTLKKTPVISGVKVDANSEEVKFDIKLNNVKDPDKAIVSYIYNIYLADDITVDNLDPIVQYSVTKADSDNLILNLNEIDELKTGVDYRAKIFAVYDDNEMIREVSTDYSNNFLIKSKPTISFELKSATMSEVVGTISLIDANCTVPMKGRSCSNIPNTFTLRYYKLEEEETNENDTVITFNSSKLTSDIHLEGLMSNTTYAVKLFGDYYDDGNKKHENVQIGDTFYVTTDKSPNIYFEVAGDNKSGYNKDGTENSSNVVTFDARLTAPQDSNGHDEIANEIDNITFKLYSGRYNVSDKLIGSYTVVDKNSIGDLFNNITITNTLFDDLTGKVNTKIDTLDKLIKVTNNATNSLNGSYTVEVIGTYNSGESIVIEDPVYTFDLTPSYYLDVRINTNPDDNYITVTPITKGGLRGSEEEASLEYQDLSKEVDNLDKLNDDTVVGLIIENSLSDMFVDSAFKYERVVVDYIICNSTTKKCDDAIAKLSDNDPENDESALKQVSVISVDMGNKYQPKEQIVYLNSKDYKDIVRGYNYKIGFNIKFYTEIGDNPIYTHEKLYTVVPIEKQVPVYNQYISSSNDSGVTYRYVFDDIDNAISDKNFYYTLGEDKETYHSVNNSLVKDGNYHDVVVPIKNNSKYSLYYARRKTNNDVEYIEMDTYDYEKELNFGKSDSYELLESNNKIRIKLFNDDVNTRSHVYKVVIKDKSGKNSEYVRYFLASKLSSYDEGTNTFDGEGNEILETFKYIDIDYANISKFMGSNLLIDIYAYYDSGLVGINQNVDKKVGDKVYYGFILESTDGEEVKYLNTFNTSLNDPTLKKDEKVSSNNISDLNMGLYLFKTNYVENSKKMFIYNKLIFKKHDAYNPYEGANIFSGSSSDLSDEIGINYNLEFTKDGVLFKDGNKDMGTYNLKVLKEVNISSKEYQFNKIVPLVKSTTSNTINSLNVNVKLSGIYGGNQFDNNKLYLDVYDDVDLTNRLNKEGELVKNIIIKKTDSGYSATVDGSFVYSNLKPDTTYYYTISAKIDGKMTRLYNDPGNVNTNTYEVKTYEAKTLNAGSILSNFNFSVKHHAYNNKSEVNDKAIEWLFKFDNDNAMKNYKIRMELFKVVGSHEETDPETGEVTVVFDYVPVKFDGSDVSSCDVTAKGNSSNGYITSDGCYISVDKGNINGVDNKNIEYIFNNKNFVHGGGYYKLVVYAVPFTNGDYVEDDKIVLYQNDSLSTINANVDGYMIDINMPELQLPTFNIGNSLTSGHNGSNGFYVSLNPIVTTDRKDISDSYGTIMHGEYEVVLYDENSNKVGESIKRKVNEIGDVIFKNLSANTLYRVEISYKTYRNNNGYSEVEKSMTIPFTDFIYTPFSDDITIGNITAKKVSINEINLIYNGSVNLTVKDKVAKVCYTISLSGGSGNRVSGCFEDSALNFVITNSKPTLKITTGDEFIFENGKTYVITTQYYRPSDMKNPIQDTNGKNSFTTMLNL